MFCAVQPCNTSSTVGAGSVASCPTPAASVFCTLLARQSVCTGGGRAQHCIEATWISVGDDGGRRGGGEGACLKWVVSFRLTAEPAVCREEQSSPDNELHARTLHMQPGQRRNCGAQMATGLF